MTLLETMFADYKLYERQTVSDGEGDFTREYVEIGIVPAAVSFPTTTEKLIAEGLKASVTSTALFKNNAPILRDHYLVSAEDNNVVYRVTSDPREKMAPSISTLPLMQADVTRVGAIGA